MTKYEALCEAYYSLEPQMVRIHDIVTAIPEKLRQAIGEHLKVPVGQASFATIIAGGNPTPYVALYRTIFSENGERAWEICPRGEEFLFDHDRIPHFTIGICLEKERGIFPASMMNLEFSIEAVDEESAELQLAKPASKLVINLRDATGYLDAAAFVMTHVLQRLKDDPPAIRGKRGPIGF